jgi:uncharacterized caspase-like protein
VWCPADMSKSRATCIAGLLSIVFLLSGHSAKAEKRVALVVGNAAYQHAAPLINPQRDARSIARTFRRLGFRVTEVLDQDFTRMHRVLQTFGRSATTADVAVIYYAGHGIEVDNRNYLIPTDARLAADIDVEFEAVALDLALAAVSNARRLRLIILDACRDNPFVVRMKRKDATRSIGRGLAQMLEPAGDTLVAYAAKAGSVAEDGKDGHSPYAQALLKHLDEPGVEIGLMFRRIRDTVLTTTGGRQEPFVYGSLSSASYYLNPAQAKAAKAAEPKTQAEPTQRTNSEISSNIRQRADLVFWQSISGSKRWQDYEAYLTQFPNGVFAGLAQTRRNEIKRGDLAASQRPARTRQNTQPPPEVTPLDERRVTTKNARVRARPDTTGDILRIAVQGTSVRVTGKVVDRNWYRIESAAGRTGFVFGELLAQAVNSAPPKNAEILGREDERQSGKNADPVVPVTNIDPSVVRRLDRLDSEIDRTKASGPHKDCDLAIDNPRLDPAEYSSCLERRDSIAKLTNEKIRILGESTMRNDQTAPSGTGPR